MVRTVLSPAWTTDWMSQPGPPQAARVRHRPARLPAARATVGLTLSARCPRCGSTSTREISRFGSTPCKSLWSCLACPEPFDSFKAI